MAEKDIYYDEPAVFANWFYVNVDGAMTRIVFCDRSGEQTTARTAVMLETGNAKKLISLLEGLMRTNEAKAGTILSEKSEGGGGGQNA